MFMCEIRHLFPFSPLSEIMSFGVSSVNYSDSEFNSKKSVFGLPVAQKLI